MANEADPEALSVGERQGEPHDETPHCRLNRGPSGRNRRARCRAAQFYIGADPYYGAGVQVGPFGAGVGPRFGWRDRYWDDGYRAYGAADCRIVRERVVTPSGRVIVQRHRVCD